MNRALRWGNTCGKEVGLDKVHLSVSAPGKVTGAGCAAGPQSQGNLIPGCAFSCLASGVTWGWVESMAFCAGAH